MFRSLAPLLLLTLLISFMRSGVPVTASGAGAMTSPHPASVRTNVHSRAPSVATPALTFGAGFLLVEPGSGLVTCQVDSAPPGIQFGSVVLADSERLSASLLGGELHAYVPAGDGTASFEFDERVAGTISWRGLEAGGEVHCVLDGPVSVWTGVHGRVVGTPIEGAYVFGCGSHATIDDAEFFLTVAAPVGCELQVMSVSETHVAEGVPVEVVLSPGADAEVVLSYPSEADRRLLTEEELQSRREMRERIEAILSMVDEAGTTRR